MLQLMCKDIPVYDIETDEALSFNLLPGIMQAECTRQNFNAWCQGRYSLKSNVFGRVQRAELYPFNTPSEIDKLSGAFSLSDCYWIKSKPLDSFHGLSPYYKQNWADDRPVANIYTNGWQAKKWLTPDLLYKNASKNEIEIIRLAKLAGLPVVSISDYGDGITVENFTSEDVMYEPADMSAAFYQDVLMDTPLPLPGSVIEKLGEFGELMLVFDSIIGNYDRHLGNFGFLRDSNSGIVLGSAPLFDFDQASPHSLNDARLLTLCTHKQSVLDMCRVIYDNTDRWEYKANCELFINNPQ
jgi:hypothetical protein